MNIGGVIHVLQETHRRGVTNEYVIDYDGQNWIVRLYDDNEHMKMQLVKCHYHNDKPEFVLLECPSWWRYSYAAEVFTMAMKLWTYGHGEEL